MVFEPYVYAEFRLAWEKLDARTASYLRSGRPFTACFGHEELICLEKRVDADIQFIPSGTARLPLTNKANLTTVRFVLINFPPLGKNNNRIVMDAKPWRVTIGQLPQGNEQYTPVSLHEKMVVTHYGEIRRGDGKAFSSNRSFDCLADVDNFLSFISAKFTQTLLPVGIDRKGCVRWESMGCNIPHSVPLAGETAPLVSLPQNTICECFAGFQAMVQDSLWRMPILESLGWYAEAAVKDITFLTGIVLCQIALELLAWNYCVEDRGLISREGFKSLRARDKFRLFYSSLGLSLKVPDEFEYMSDWAESNKFQDVPRILTEVRNSIVHPVRKPFREDYALLYEDCWELGLIGLRDVIVCLSRNFTPVPERIINWAEIRHKNRSRA